MKLFRHVLALAILCVSLEPVGATDVTTGASLDLQEAQVFAFGGIGYAGVTSKGEVAFRELWKNSRASALFAALFEKATPEGKCYALVALRECAPDLFKRYSDEFRKNPPAQVHAMSGCIGEEIAGLRALAEVEAGKYTHFIPKKKDA